MYCPSIPPLNAHLRDDCEPSLSEEFQKSEYVLRLTLEGCNEANLFHDVMAMNGDAYFSVLSGGTKKSDRRQRCYPVSSLQDVLRELAPAADTWITQAEFSAPTRRIVDFQRVSVCWVDVDTYKIPELQYKLPEQLLSILLRKCQSEGLPEPSLVVFSGRGLQVKWLLHSAVERPNLPLWNALQRELCRRLMPIGGDPLSSDGSRVLRLVDSFHSVSGEQVRVIHSPLHTYNFETFANALPATQLPVLDGVLELGKGTSEPGRLALREWTCGPDPITPRVSPGHVVTETSLANLRRFLPSKLAWDRLGDLDKLAEIRGYRNGAPDGMRDAFIFASATFLSQAVYRLPEFSLEVEALAGKYAPHWSKERVRQCISGVVDRIRIFSSGKCIEFQGRCFDPRYTFSNSKLLDWLKISADEETQLVTIISKFEKARRDRVHKQFVRREAGVIERDIYLAEVGSTAEQRHASARLLRQQSKTWAEVAVALGYKNAVTARVACSR